MTMDPTAGSPSPEIFRTILCTRCKTEFVSQERRHDFDSTQEKFRARYLPSEYETAQISASIQDYQRDLESYDLEIQSLSRTLDALKKQREKLQDVINENWHLISAVRRLPVEVLMQIFTSTCADGGLVVSQKRIDAPALAVSQVCFTWQNIILHSPELWSSLIIDVTNGRWCVKELIKLYLNRSRDVPLTLYIFARCKWLADDGYYSSWPEGISCFAMSIVSILLQESARWNDVSISMHRKVMEKISAEFPSKYNLEQLQRLDVEWEPDSVINAGKHFVRMLAASDNLHTLALNDFDDLLFGDLLFGYQLKSVKKVALLGMVVDSDVAEFFDRLPNMEDLDIEDLEENYRPSEMSTLPQIISHSLKRLSLKFRPSMKASHFISISSFPCLTGLCLNRSLNSHPSETNGYATWLGNLKGLLHRSPCLERLEMEHKLFRTTTDILEILFTTPNLNYLKIIHSKYFINEQLFSGLTLETAAENSHTNILPRLTHLDIGFRNSRRGPIPPNAFTLALSRRGSVLEGYCDLESFHYGNTQLLTP